LLTKPSFHSGIEWLPGTPQKGIGTVVDRSSWEILMTEEPLSWLLEAETPAIRYLALLDLMGLPEEDGRVQQARQAIMRQGPVPAILAHQTEEGNWAGEYSFYTPKYRSTHWSLLLLTELHVDGEDPRFRRGVEFMLGEVPGPLTKRLAGNGPGWSCLYGNVLRYVCHAGLAGDDGAAAVIDYCLREIDNRYCRCPWNDGYACAWGVARTLWGLAAIPQSMRSPAIDRAIQQGLEFLLAPGRLPAADYPVPDGGRVHAFWSRLNFPLFYQADVLFVLRVVNELGALDQPGAQEALAWLAARRQKNGRWRGSSPFRQRTWPQLGGPEETGRWVTLQAQALVAG
jgi:hypothetical protein